MKNLIIILIALFGLSLISCEESSITDPNVEKTPVNPTDPGDGGNGSPFYQATDINYSVLESYFDDFFGTEVEWQGSINVQRNQIMFDTTDNKIRMFIDISINSTIPDFLFSYRDDRIVGISTIIDTLEINNNFISRSYNNLNHSDFEIRVKNLDDNTFNIKSKHDVFGTFQGYFYTDNTFELEFMFRMVDDEEDFNEFEASMLLMGINGKY